MDLSRADWAGHVEEWRRSGETAATYCDEHGLKLSSLRYWSSRIRREGPRAGRGSAGESAVRFASVRRTETTTPATAAPSGVRVRVGAVTVEVSPGFDEATLERVLRLLATNEVER